MQTIIPKNLKGALLFLDKILIKIDVDFILNMKEEAVGQLHFTLGRYLRNNWKLWSADPIFEEKSDLVKYFNRIGIYHADDMSNIILKSYWRFKHNKPINLKTQVKDCKRYWNNQIVQEIIE